MKLNQLKPNSGIRPGQSQEPVRAWVLAMIAMIGLALVAILVVAWQNMGGSSQEEPATGERTMASSKAGDVGAARKEARSRPARTPARSFRENKGSPVVTDPTARARVLVQTLAQVDVAALTPETAAAWQRNLAELLNLGTAAVPALAEYFQKNEDVRFDSQPGPNLVGESSLRTAFIKVLFDIPDPENVELQTTVLRTAVDPDEIALMARQLELQEPGKHRDLIIEAARRCLEAEQTGGLSGRNTAPLHELLKQYEEPPVK